MKPKNKKPFRVVVADPLHSTGWALLKAAPDVIVEGPFDCSADLQTVLLDADALLICSDTKVDTDLLDAAPLLKVIARAGSRLDNVDIDEAARRGIFVIHVPEANLVAVVEYTFLLMLMLARRLSPHSNRQPCGDGVFGFELAHKTLGIIGFGHQGREVAARAQAFGMHVLAYDPYVDLSFAREQRVEIVGLSELLARGDIISLHTDYTPQTHHIIDADAFSKMKPGVYLINSLHVDLVDRVALMAALKNEALGGVALDRWETGALEDESPFTNQTKVLILDNQGQATLEAQSNTAKAVVSDMLAALRREDYHNVVNLPFTQAHSYQAVKPYMDLAVKLGKLQGQLADGWINRVEVELLGEGLQDLVRPVAAILLSGMIRRVDERPVNWISAPVLAYEQGIATSQAKELVQQGVYPAMIACRVSWEGGQRTVAGALFGNGEVRLVTYDDFAVDAHPDGYVLILENDDVPGVIGKVGTRLSQEKINIAQWRYGRDFIGGRGVSFINLDNRVPDAILEELEREVEIHHAQLVRL